MSALERTQSDSSSRARVQTLEDRRNGELIVEDISGYDIGYDADIEVLRPYQYEEVDSESSDLSFNRSTPKQVDIDEIWQSRLIDSMKTLHCDSDRESRRIHRSQKRSRKRKSRGSFGDQRSAPISSDYAQLELVGLDNNGLELGSKKPRRKSEHSGDDRNASNLWISDAPKQDESSSTATLSVNTVAESISAPAQAYGMDID